LQEDEITANLKAVQLENTRPLSKEPVHRHVSLVSKTNQPEVQQWEKEVKMNNTDVHMENKLGILFQPSEPTYS
jgi:hypothetical protein